jgi:hypothetical protein
MLYWKGNKVQKMWSPFQIIYSASLNMSERGNALLSDVWACTQCICYDLNINAIQTQCKWASNSARSLRGSKYQIQRQATWTRVKCIGRLELIKKRNPQWSDKENGCNPQQTEKGQSGLIERQVRPLSLCAVLGFWQAICAWRMTGKWQWQKSSWLVVSEVIDTGIA